MPLSTFWDHSLDFPVTFQNPFNLPLKLPQLLIYYLFQTIALRLDATGEQISLWNFPGWLLTSRQTNYVLQVFWMFMIENANYVVFN